MLSYIIGILCVGILFGDPIREFFFPPDYGPYSGECHPYLAPKPQMDESLLALVGPNDTALECPPDAYGARILNTNPLVVYLEGFLSEQERRHLLDISEPLYEPSTITHQADDVNHDTTVRDSSVALIPRTDVVRCIEARARALQGWRQDVFIERLRTQKYTEGGHYNHHFDCGANVGGWGRVSSFMAWVDAADGLEGGGTDFPQVDIRGEGDERWCELVDCKDGGVAKNGPDGTVFKPVAGNAVYWENFASDGRMYEETWHAGLPVTKGVKVGLNIWSIGRIL